MFDGHCHLDCSLGNAENAVKQLHDEAVKSGVGGIVLLNIPDQGFSNEEVFEQTQSYGGFFYVFPGLNITRENIAEDLSRFVALGAKGIKLHPRIHNYSLTDPRLRMLLGLVQEANLPVLIDCFPDGRNLVLGNRPEAIGALASEFPDLRIAIGHAGGHHIMDAMMVAKSYKNIYLDLSFTLLYYRDTTIADQCSYCLKNMKYERVFVGTDYPDRPYSLTLVMTCEELTKLKITGSQRDRLFEENIALYLGGNR